jgi:hypothetical protein
VVIDQSRVRSVLRNSHQLSGDGELTRSWVAENYNYRRSHCPSISSPSEMLLTAETESFSHCPRTGLVYTRNLCNTLCVMAEAGGKRGWFGRRRAPRVRQCSECGYTWKMPHRRGRWWSVPSGLPAAPMSPLGQSSNLHAVAPLIRQQAMSGAAGDAEVKEALSHCPQCGSGHFVQYRADPSSGTT